MPSVAHHVRASGGYKARHETPTFFPKFENDFNM
jgi:hypothetical protein